MSGLINKRCEDVAPHDVHVWQYVESSDPASFQALCAGVTVTGRTSVRRDPPLQRVPTSSAVNDDDPQDHRIKITLLHDDEVEPVSIFVNELSLDERALITALNRAAGWDVIKIQRHVPITEYRWQSEPVEEA